MATVRSLSFVKFDAITARDVPWYYVVDNADEAAVVGVLAVGADGVSHVWQEPSGTGTEGVVVADLPAAAVKVCELSP